MNDVIMAYPGRQAYTDLEGIHMLEKSISSERGKTYYWTENRDSSFMLVFLPGLTANHHLFDRQLAAFSE